DAVLGLHPAGGGDHRDLHDVLLPNGLISPEVPTSPESPTPAPRRIPAGGPLPQRASKSSRHNSSRAWIRSMRLPRSSSRSACAPSTRRTLVRPSITADISSPCE